VGRAAALLIGNQQLGRRAAGALCAIPAAAALAVIVDELHRERLVQPEVDTIGETQHAGLQTAVSA
jgi:hypothetical protein